MLLFFFNDRHGHRLNYYVNVSYNNSKRDDEEAATDVEMDVEGDVEDGESVGSGEVCPEVAPETVSSSSAPAGGERLSPPPLRRSRTVSATNVAPQVYFSLTS